MLNLLSYLDFVFVLRVFNFVSCPGRHMRWKLFPDVSKDYSMASFSGQNNEPSQINIMCSKSTSKDG